jgi:hypothetical protein
VASRGLAMKIKNKNITTVAGMEMFLLLMYIFFFFPFNEEEMVVLQEQLIWSKFGGEVNIKLHHIYIYIYIQTQLKSLRYFWEES